jgi:hypothetical protein
MAARFQFSMKNALAATTWAAIWCSLYPILGIVNDSTLSERLVAVLRVGLMFLAMCLPYVALGTLIGKTNRGWLTGTVVAIIILVAMMLIPPTQ